MEVSGGETLAFISFPPHKDLPPAVIEKQKVESRKLEKVRRANDTGTVLLSPLRCRSNHCIPEKPGLLLVVLGEAEIKGQLKVVYVLPGVNLHHFPFDLFADLTFFSTA